MCTRLPQKDWETLAQNIRLALFEEAIFLLQEVDPIGAQVYWSHKIEKVTEKDLAQRYGVDEKTVRRWLNGNNERGMWGAKDLLANILDLLVEAHSYNRRKEVRLAILFAMRHKLFPQGSPTTVLSFFWDAMDNGDLERVLTQLAECDRQQYGRVLSSFLQNFQKIDP